MARKLRERCCAKPNKLWQRNPSKYTRKHPRVAKRCRDAMLPRNLVVVKDSFGIPGIQKSTIHLELSLKIPADLFLSSNLTGVAECFNRGITTLIEVSRIIKCSAGHAL